jgi:hypothetical protein
MISTLHLFDLVYLCPLLIFLDFNKRSNWYIAAIYVAVFFVFWLFILRPLIDTYGLWFAASAPFALLVICSLSRRKKQ